MACAVSQVEIQATRVRGLLGLSRTSPELHCIGRSEDMRCAAARVIAWSLKVYMVLERLRILAWRLRVRSFGFGGFGGTRFYYGTRCPVPWVLGFFRLANRVLEGEV